MSKIPDEDRAARALYEAFAELGRSRGGQPAPGAEQRAPRRGFRRILVVVPLTLLTLAAGATAARVLLDDGAPIPAERGLPAHERRAAADAALAAVRAADPYGGLRWGERIYASTTGARCALAGRLRDGVLGVVLANRFSALPPDAPGACGRPGARTLIARQEAAEGNARSILYGFVDRSVRGIEIVDGRRRTSVPVAADGSFLIVTKDRLRGTLVMTTAGRDIRRKLDP